MGLLTRNLLRRITIPAIMGFVVICFLGVANKLQTYLKDLDVTQITFDDVAKLAILLVPSLMALAIPITYLMGILMAFGALAHTGELTAMKAAGIPMRRMVMPTIVAGVLLSIAAFIVQDRVQPWAIGRVYAFIYEEVPVRLALEALPEGKTYPIGDTRIYFRKKDTEQKVLYDIVIMTNDDTNSQKIYYADSAHIIYPEQSDGVIKLRMENGKIIQPREGNHFVRPSFASMTIPLRRPESQKTRGERRSFTMSQLFKMEKEVKAEYAITHHPRTKEDLRKLRRELSERLAMPLMCLAVCMLAAPLGARAKGSGRSYTFAIGFIIIVAYYVMRLTLEPQSLRSLTTFIIRAQIPNLVMVTIGMYLIWKVDRV